MKICAECGKQQGKFVIIHPEMSLLVWVCEDCEAIMAQRIATKQSRLASRSEIYVRTEAGN